MNAMRRMRGLVLAFGATVGLGAPPAAVAGGGAEAAGEVALRGIVLDAAAKPVAGAAVSAYHIWDVASALVHGADGFDIGVPEPTVRASSGADGRFRAAGVARGRYVLRVEAKGHGLGVLDGGVAWDGGGPKVVVTLPPAIAVEGEVVDATGRGLAGLDVAFGPSQEYERRREWSLFGRAVGKTGTDGRFRIEGAPAGIPADGLHEPDGNFTLHVRLPAGHHLMRQYWGRRPNRLRVTVRTQPDVEITALEKETGNPIAGAIALAQIFEETDEAKISTVMARATAGREGRVRLAGLPPGEAKWIAVAAPGYGTWLTEDGSPVAGADAPEKTASGLVVRVPKGMTAHGRILDGAGKPVPTARVLNQEMSRSESDAAVDAQGQWEIRGIPLLRRPQGALSLLVRAPGYVLAPESGVIRFTRDATDIVHDVALVPASSIAGRVVDAENKPVAGAIVWATSRAGSDAILAGDVRSGTDGAFILPGVAAATLRVKAEQGSFGGGVDLDLGAGEQRIAVEIRIGPPVVPPAPPPPDIATLVGNLKSPDQGVRWGAARDLGARGADARSAIPALLAALDDPVPNVAHIAAYALTQIGGLEASTLPAVTRLLARDPAAGAKVVATMGALAAPAVPAVLRALSAQKRGGAEFELVKALVAIGEPAVPDLLTALRAPDEDYASNAGRALREIGRAAVPGSLKAAQDPDAKVRARAISSLGPAVRGFAAQALPILLTALDDADMDLRWAAVAALQSLGPDAKEAGGRLARELDRGTQGERCHVLAAIGAIGHDAAPLVPRLVGLLEKDSDPQVRAAAAEALGSIGDAAAIGPLLAAAKDPDPEVRWAPISALGRFGSAAREAVPLLIAALDDPKAGAPRWRAVGSLSAMGADARAATPRLLAIVRDSSDDSLRESCLEALAAVADAKDVVPALIPILAREDSSALWGAVAAVRALGEAAAPVLPTVLERLRRGEPGHSHDLEALAQTLPALGPGARAAAPILLDRLEGRVLYFEPAEAAATLLEMGVEVEKAKPVALWFLMAGPEVRRNVPLLERTARAFGALGAAAKDAVPALERLLDDEHPDVRAAAAEALGKIRRK